MMRNAVIPLHPRQNCHLRESPQHLLSRPTCSPKGSLDHTKVAADNEQACSPRGEEGREQAESRQGWEAQGPSYGSLGAQQVVAWPQYGVTVPTVPLAKSTGCSLGVQSPGLSPARDGSRETGLSQHPASRQELHGCNHTAVGAWSQTAGSPWHRVPPRDMAQAELGCSHSMPQCQGDGLAPHTPWLSGPCLQAACWCQCRAGRRQGTGRSLCPPPACPACLQPHTCPVSLPCNTMPKEGRGGYGPDELWPCVIHLRAGWPWHGRLLAFGLRQSQRLLGHLPWPDGRGTSRCCWAQRCLGHLCQTLLLALLVPGPAVMLRMGWGAGSGRGLLLTGCAWGWTLPPFAESCESPRSSRSSTAPSHPQHPSSQHCNTQELETTSSPSAPKILWHQPTC